jgi:NAD dependent epimerase/dehydratase family enzyme
VIVMRVFVAGGAGAIGRRLVRHLVACGHQMTALSAAHAGRPSLRNPDRFFATTIRLRTEGTDHLLAAVEAAGVSHIVAQWRGFSNAKAKRELGWQLRYPSWRQGFMEELA